MNLRRFLILSGTILFLHAPCFASAFLPTEDALNQRSRAQKASDTAQVDRVLAAVPAGQDDLQIDDMRFRVADLRRKSAFVAPLWPDGKVYYQFESDISSTERQAWLNGATLWATVANVTFTARSTEPNYIHIARGSTNSSHVGMAGGQQEMTLLEWDWNGMVAAHEIGHALGLIHEQCRTDRDDYVTVYFENITTGWEYNFDKVTATTTYGPYDFDSIMHYSKNAFSKNPVTLNTIEPKPAYSQWLDLMGLDDHLSVLDALGMAQAYGGLGTLPPPTGLTAKMSPLSQYTPIAPGQASLTWNAVPGATHYVVFYEEVDDGPPFTPTQNGSPASGTDVGKVTQLDLTGLAPGHRYYFSVKALSQVLESDYSYPTATTRSRPSTTEDDAYAVNDTSGKAYDLSAYEGTWLSGLLGLGIQRDVDWYKITVTSGQWRVRVKATFNPLDGEIVLNLFDHNSSFIANAASTSGSVAVDYVVQTPGTYYVEVGGQNTSVPYDLTWSDTEVGAEGPYAGDTDNSGLVDAVDVQQCINAALSLEVPVGVRPDIDFSGTVDAVDVQLVINAALGITIDSDGDGLCDAAETRFYSGRWNRDSDGDGVSDYQEVLNGTSPIVAD